MTSKNYSMHQVVSQPQLFFQRMVQTYPENTKMFLWMALCCLLPAACAILLYVRFYQALGITMPAVMHAGILLSGIMAEVIWWLAALAIGYLSLGPQARVGEIAIASLTPFLLWGGGVAGGKFLFAPPGQPGSGQSATGKNHGVFQQR